MVAQIEGFKHEQFLFVDEVLKQLGELAFLVVFFNQAACSRQRFGNRGGEVSSRRASFGSHNPTVRTY